MPPKYVTVFDCKNEINEIRNEETISQHVLIPGTFYATLQGGCVDSTNQSMTALFMILGQQDVSKVQTGPLTPYT